MGSRLAAFLAGYQPKNMPVAEHTAKLSNTLQGWICMGQCANTLIPTAAPIPTITPIKPPVTLSKTDSIKNWFSISIPRAPTDIRKPISLVRSVTLTYMIFIIPIPPTTSEIHATTNNRTVIVSDVEFIISAISCWLLIVKLSSSEAFNL